MNPKPIESASPLMTLLWLLTTVLVFLFVVWRLNRKGQTRVDEVMELARAQLAAQHETNRLLTQLIKVQSADR